MKYCVLTVLLSLLTQSYAWGFDSQSIWESYFPEADCQSHDCARDVPEEALYAALDAAYGLRLEKLRSTKWFYITDMSQHSSKKRGYLITLPHGDVEQMIVSHGTGSGDGNGNAVRFSNTDGSKMTSLGLYETSTTYYGNNGYSLNLHGLEDSNDNAYTRRIVLHGATYARESHVNTYGRAGRSWGCPAVDDRLAQGLIDKLKGGSLYYIYSNR